ncbi:tripartite tricarboxylate transporter substrate binding protein [Roseomonas frigidaquae]|uniref:Tripartite tricarboxylate transporter substrate binding protein n=1 Tax=Falsiroseomonas frigidaquae TaxID=487318 RepID=A0ABX1F7T1_9PROT|nr:tripartite tricarboxylate transporter substrate binding protein [Falsiroseomonas frigidaquae]NKE48286.1 tripartite tricarboxylate transporter substrate binding protein [Falsiroseomonas frigidaquae]
MLRRHALGLLAAPFLLPRGATAQAAWTPTRPVTLVVPFPPGGPTDLAARVVQQGMSAALGQPVVVDNRPGATGAIGSRYVAQQPADGHTLLVAASGTLTINPVVMRTPGYDVEKDFVPVTLVMTAPNMLVVHPSIPVHNVAEVVAWMKTIRGGPAYASSGVGSSEQLGMELFKLLTGTEAIAVPFAGGPAAATAVIQNTAPFAVLNAATVGTHVQAGRLRGIAICGPNRFPQLPDVKTMAEQGLPDHVSGSWTAIVAPAATPEPALARLNEVIVAALKTPEVTERLARVGFAVDATSRQALGKLLADDLARWRRVVREARIEVN